MPRPPISTLFPYTTLFRSRRHLREIEPFVLMHADQLAINRQGRAAGSQPQDAVRLLDRKSTRLNSSHTVNSYAVFGLNKKKAARPLAAHAYQPAMPVQESL